MIRIGVTGTDTGVGKTVVTCAIAAALRGHSLKVVAMKPIETGVAADDPTRDGARIARAAGSDRPLEETAPLVFSRPLAPLIAARQDGVAIDTASLDRAIALASHGADALIVEGAGGLLVPVSGATTFAELFRRWSLDLVVVAANRLGVINHTLLTVRAARTAGLVVRAIVLNSLSSSLPDESAEGNLELLRELIPDVPVVPLPWTADVDDLPSLVQAAERSNLIRVFV